jgi:hypothetical protein
LRQLVSFELDELMVLTFCSCTLFFFPSLSRIVFVSPLDCLTSYFLYHPLAATFLISIEGLWPNGSVYLATFL